MVTGIAAGNVTNVTTVALPESVQKFAATLSAYIGTISWAIGGIFGLYLILIFLRWRQFRKMNDILEDIRHNLLALNKKLDVKGVSKEMRYQEGSAWDRIKGNFKKFFNLFRRKK